MTIPDSENSFNGTLMAEAYFQTFTILNRFTRLADSGLLNITVTTLSRLVRQVMRQTAIPFHGEPVVGLQIVGMLETRVLDFENILMLSVNEGYLPEKTPKTLSSPINYVVSSASPPHYTKQRSTPIIFTVSSNAPATFA